MRGPDAVDRAGRSPLGGSFRALHFAVRPRVLARYLGQIFLVLAALTSVPALVALSTGHGAVALRYAVVVLALGAAGVGGARMPCSDDLQPNEALAISALAFLVSGLVMAFPLAGYGIAPLDAVFEAISGVTTTGLSTLGTLDGRPPAFFFARAWLQWVGGLGVVVLALAISIPSGAAAKRLGFDEREAGGYVGSTRGHARRVLGVYVALTVVGCALCVLSGMGGLDAVAHTLAAVSTGGFSTSDASLATHGATARTVVSLLCLASALPFSLYFSRSLRSALGARQTWTLLAFAVSGGLLLGALTPELSWSDAAWTAVSAQTTAGFSTVPPEQIPASGKLVLVGGMLVGGEVGSTAGGLKILRLIILVQLVLARMVHASMPRGSQVVMRLDGIRLRRDEIEGAAALVLVYGATLAASWLAFVAHGYDPLDSLFEITSALGTVGLSVGTTRPELEPILKCVLCADMLMGRVEVFAFLMLVFPGTWIGRRRSSR